MEATRIEGMTYRKVTVGKRQAKNREKRILKILSESANKNENKEQLHDSLGSFSISNSNDCKTENGTDSEKEDYLSELVESGNDALDEQFSCITERQDSTTVTLQMTLKIP